MRAVNLKIPDRIPITPLMDYYYAASNGMSSYDFICGPFKKVFRAVEKTHQKFNEKLDMVHLPMGRLYAFYNMLPLGPSGFYGDLKYSKKIPSSLQFIEKAYIDIDDFKKIKNEGLKSIWKPINPRKVKKTQIDLLRITRFVDYWENKKRVPIYASTGIVTPLESLCYLMGIRKWSKAVLKDPEKMREMCDFMLDAVIANNYFIYVISRIKRSYICLERVSSTFISPELFEELVLPDLLKIVKENVKNDLITVFHMDTDWTPFLHYFKEMPKNGKYILHLEDTNIFKAKEMLGGRFCLMGNVPTKLMRFGSEEKIKNYLRRLIDECGEAGGYMMSCGCEVAPDTPFKNLKLMVDVTLKYGRY
ncbi:MAG: hypothetical protein GF353_23295 [Candidatus Lokiarchaeota archaeon]|nr:hypothetical protein [Candidatus Lokiarchaeota archaeon]